MKIKTIVFLAGLCLPGERTVDFWNQGICCDFEWTGLISSHPHAAADEFLM